MPSVNYLLLVLTIAIIAGFNGDGVRLGNAYGEAHVACVPLSLPLGACWAGEPPRPARHVQTSAPVASSARHLVHGEAALRR